MAQTGYTPIQLYYSSTTTNAPTAGNLAYGELAINITDGKLFYKDNANAVQVIGWKVVLATAGGTGQTSYAVGDLLYADTTTTLAKLADVAMGNALISGGVGVAPSWGKIGLTTHVSGTLPTANGGTNLTSFTSGGVVYASSTSALTTGSSLVFDGTNLGVGTASPTTPLQIQGAAATNVNSIFCTGSTTAYNFWTISNTSGNARIGVDSSSGGALATGSSAYSTVIGSPNATPLHFISNGIVQATIESSQGNLFVNQTSQNGAGKTEISFDRDTNWGMQLRNTTGTTAAATYISFKYVNTTTGSIESTGTVTTYNTVSDYRLKNTVVPMTGALEKVALLKPCTYKWNSDNSDGQGFIAHELQAVVPDCVTGTKDELDADGNAKYQSLDTSFLIATLTAAIQEQQALIKTLAARITVLESA